jgi:hypothetical protein
MAKLESILRGMGNLARSAVLAGSLLIGISSSGCDNPVEQPPPVIPPKPKSDISLTAELKNSVDVSYTAKIKNLDNATLTVSRDGNPVAFRMITDSVYSETLSYSTNKNVTKGNYNLVLAGKTPAGRDTSIIANQIVPNYNPEISLSGISANMDEGSEINPCFDGKILDTNPEDHPNIADATSQDGKTTVSINGNNVRIKSIDGKIGNYSVRVWAGDNLCGKGNVILAGTIEDLLDVGGVLEDNEQHLRQSGVVRVYDGKMDPVTQRNKKLGEIIADATGQFNTRLNYRIGNLADSILVQGRKIENGTEKSYVRTIKIPRGDVRGLTLRVVPYDGLAENGITKEDFRRHMGEVLTGDNTNGKGIIDALNLNPIMYKWDFENNSSYPFKEIIISKTPKNPNIQAFFSQTTAENIKARILDKEDIGAWFNGKVNNPNQIRVVNNYIIDYNSTADYGRMVIYPEINQYLGFFLDIYPEDGYINFGETFVIVNEKGEIIPGALTHEFGHSSGMGTNMAGSHALTLPQEKTIMVPYLINLNYSTPRFADKKTAKIIYEDSYKHGQGNMMKNNLIGLYYIVGMKFIDE